MAQNYQLMTYTRRGNCLHVKMVLPKGLIVTNLTMVDDSGYETGNLKMKVVAPDNWGDRTIVGRKHFMTHPFVLVHIDGCTLPLRYFPGRYDYLLSQGWDGNTHFMELEEA